MLLRWWRRRRTMRPSAEALYAAIVAQARQPAFHAALGVPDTLMGRYQLLALHVILLLQRLLDEGGVVVADAAAAASESTAAVAADAGDSQSSLAAEEDASRRRELARLLQERMFDDMDSALREIGVSDLAVPKRMRRLAELFYGQLKVYQAALQADDMAALQQALRRNIFVDAQAEGGAGKAEAEERQAVQEGGDVSSCARALAEYARQVHRTLAMTPLRELEQGRIAWPRPAAGGGDDAQTR